MTTHEWFARIQGNQDALVLWAVSLQCQQRVREALRRKDPGAARAYEVRAEVAHQRLEAIVGQRPAVT